MMDGTEQTTARITAHFLATARYVAAVNLVLFITALVLTRHLWPNIGLAAVLLYLHIRIAFDQRVFAEAERINWAIFDRTLVSLGLAKPKPERDLLARAKGAIRLWYCVIYASVIQLSFLLF